MTVPRARWWSLVVLSVYLVACRPDPKDAQFWVKELQGAKRTQDKVRVIDDLRKSEHLSKDFLPMLHEQLAAQKVPELKAAIARVLTDLKDPSSVQPLMDSVDTGISGSAGDRMNREIARALGELKDPKATPTLLKLLNVRDPFVELQAAEALGQLKAREAVDPLLKLAQDETKEAPVANRAIASLGDIGDPAVIPQLIQLMFVQRGQVSLYEASAFALYRMGKPAADALLPVLAGSDTKLASWAAQKNVAPAALYSKAAQVLGYLLDTRAESQLIQRLSFKADDATQQSYVRLTAADALGRLRSKNAVKLLSSMLDEEEILVHASYLKALGRIASRDAMPALLAAGKTGMWEQRSPVLEAIALSGDGREVPAMEAMAEEEAAHVATECADSDQSLCKKQNELTHRRGEVYQTRLAVLKAAEKCQEKYECWKQALDDKSPSVRARAALTLGRSHDGAQIGALLAHVNDTDPEARLAILYGADWLTESDPAALKAGKGAIESLQAQLTKDEGKSDWVEANDNLKRLIAKLDR